MKREKLDIVYQDKYISVINKPYGLLSVSTEKEKENTLFHKVLTYEKQKHKSNKVFIVHRLDKDTSGLVLFAKTEIIKRKLQDEWDTLVKRREYTAVVEGVVKENTKTIKSYLKENTSFVSYSTKNKEEGKLAITKYKKLKSSNRYSLLEIEILTGRKNQIRVHMNEIGHPIIGDKKYGSKTNPIKRMGLHANKLEFVHPVTNELLKLESKVPTQFFKLFE